MKNFINTLLLAIALLGTPSIASALSMGRDGQPHVENEISWQPMHIEMNGHDAKFELPGKASAMMSNGSIFTQSKHEGLLYKVFYFDLKALEHPETQEQFYDAVANAIKGSNLTITPISVKNPGVVYAAELLYANDQPILQRIYQTKDAIYSLVGSDNEITLIIFDSFSIDE